MPPSAITFVEPLVPPGIGTAVPHSRRWSRFGTSDQVKLLDVGVFMNQVLGASGPATSVRPDGITNMCG